MVQKSGDIRSSSPSPSTSTAESTPLPVFLQPTELNFVIHRPETHKQVITVYNPYEFPLRFTILSNAPSQYKVVEPRGFIRSKCYVDIMVRHLSVNQSSPGTQDLLRVEIHRDGDLAPSSKVPFQPCGRKDILLTLLATESASGVLDDQSFKAFPIANSGTFPRGALKGTSQRHVSFASGAIASGPMSQVARPNPPLGNFYWFFILGFFTCVITLMLPTYDSELSTNTGTPALEESQPHSELAAGYRQRSYSSPFSISSFIPQIVRPSHTLQLVAAYVLGLLTVYLIQPNQ